MKLLISKDGRERGKGFQQKIIITCSRRRVKSIISKDV